MTFISPSSLFLLPTMNIEHARSNEKTSITKSRKNENMKIYFEHFMLFGFRVFVIHLIRLVCSLSSVLWDFRGSDHRLLTTAHLLSLWY